MSRRIIVVLPDAPLPFGGAASRWYYVLLKGLQARGNDVTTVCAIDASDVEKVRRLFPPAAFDLRLYTKQQRVGPMAKWNSFRRPHSYPFSELMKSDLHDLLRQGCDVLHLEQLWSGWIGLEATQKALLNIHYSFEIDLDGHKARNAADWVRMTCTRRAMRYLVGQYPTISTVSPRLTDHIRAMSPEANVQTVPIGIEGSLYPFRSNSSQPHRPVVGLIGSFNWYPSYSAAERLLTRLWPAIRAAVPSAQLRIIGRGARSALGALAADAGAELYENVPDILPYFQGLDLMLYAPEQGSGMKVKVMEAFALGVPVVTNADGVEGLPVQDGVHAGVAEEDEGLVARAIALLKDPEEARRRALAGRALLEHHCGPTRVLDQLESVYDRVGRAAAKAAA